ncbi:MAG TPA: AlkA N-terminal domain-containing protein [Bryobacteraceae bacterium]|nr:AlkA N-terminal domain-containing protein [Bryobacteraceae bacterium]
MTHELPFEPPFDWAALIAFLAPRAIPGIEAVVDGEYRRGRIAVRFSPEALLVSGAREEDLPRIRHLFDLDADSRVIDRHLARDPRLKPLVRSRPGIRVPGAWDAFELSVRAILGQQVSVKGATTLAGRISDFRPEALAEADLTKIGLPRARAASISALAAAVVSDPDLFRDATVESLCELPGIGSWTAQYIAMRALHQRDAFPASDLGLLRAMRNIGASSPEPWRPWRAYAAMRLWLQA